LSYVRVTDQDSTNHIWVHVCCPCTSVVAERLRFLDQFKQTASWDDEGYTLFWREKSVPCQYGRLYVISKGATLAQATDAAIERYNRKHGITGGGRWRADLCGECAAHLQRAGLSFGSVRFPVPLCELSVR
jgi:hypothetical protein